MIRLFSASSILALAAVPALAQTVEPAPITETPEAVVSEDTATPQADVAAPPADVEAPSTETQAPVAQTREERATALVEAEFATYDTDQNGELSQTEFSAWVMTLAKAKSGDTATETASVKAAKEKWAAGAFVAADTDKSTKVSKAEMSSFLQG